ncbi:14633_t:CDS:10 [Ambispora leptoticha]|uniref:14633_t:CDS:1 n=1 Tax=Ambispora leptoticha TaxID=144679 RepID=A0A9N8YYA8_9GLOM|nr:14633_t:CDS:10 [Ambispora leptoticha]
MGNTQSNQPSNSTTLSNETNNDSTFTAPETANPLSQTDPAKAVAAGQLLNQSSFRNDFASSPQFARSPLLPPERNEDIYYDENSQGSLASSFNESEILAGIGSDSPTKMTLEPPSTPPSSSPSSVEPSPNTDNEIPNEIITEGEDMIKLQDEQEESKAIPTIITWSQGGNNVFVTGSFNNWKKNIRLCKSSNDFTTVIALPSGTHKLKFIVDDEWKCSNDLEIATDSDGNLVNYVEVFEDEAVSAIDQDTLEPTNSPGVLCTTPPGEYTSEIPGYLLAYAHSLNVAENNLIHHYHNQVSMSPHDLFQGAECMAENQPPSLPPHLEKVLLNSTVSKEDNSVLPVPNHVVLNHLYACSIRDGVMAVASTARYRKKLGAGNNNMMVNSGAFQSRQPIQAASNSAIPPISTFEKSVYNPNISTANNVVGFQTQNSVNGLGIDVYQQQQQQGIIRLPQHLSQFNSPRQQITPQQNYAQIQQTHPQQSSHQTLHDVHRRQNPKPYEPAPDLNPVQKQNLETYIKRDALYQKALDLQHRRQMALIAEKRREMEIAHNERKTNARSASSVFGPGYDGYGNGTTGNKFRIIYPHDRKRFKKTKEFSFSGRELEEIAYKEDSLVPIRLEIDLDGHKLRDTFTWNMNETIITPEQFAEVLCDDLRFPSASFVPAIAKQIHEQIQGFYLHPAITASTLPPLAPNEVNSGKSTESFLKIVDKLKNANSGENSDDMDIEIPERVDHDQLVDEGELRILIKIDVTVGNISLVDQFEWDINCQKNDPELFAEILTAELGLGGEFKTAIAHSIREQVQIYVKSLILVGHPFDGSTVQDDDLRQNFLPALSSVIRKEEQVDQHTPILVELTEAEIDKIEKDRERDARRKRRQTRGRRGVILPDREPPKTHRTLLHNTMLIPDPADETSLIPVIASGMPPVQRKASSMGYDNYSAISEKPVTPAPGKLRGRGRTAAVGGSNLRSAMSADMSDSHMNRRSGSANSSTTIKESKESTKRQYRRAAAGTASEEWTCFNCGCLSSQTPLLRKGPGGEKTLCNACGLYFQKNNTLRRMTASGDMQMSTSTSQEGSPTRASSLAADSSSIVHPKPTRISNMTSISNLESMSDEMQEDSKISTNNETSDKISSTSNTSNRNVAATSGSSHKDSSDTLSNKTSKSGPSKSTRRKAGPHLTTHSTSNSAGSLQATTKSSHLTPGVSSSSRSIPASPPNPTKQSSTKTAYPEWIVLQRDLLARKYPRDRFDITERSNKPNEFRIRCSDCPGRLYQPGPDLTLNNFEIHLKNRIHRENVEKRINPNHHESETNNSTSEGNASASSKSRISKPRAARPESPNEQASRVTIESSTDTNNIIIIDRDHTVAIEAFIDNRSGVPETPPNTTTSPAKQTKAIYSVSKDKSIQVIDVSTGELLVAKHNAHDGPINCVQQLNQYVLATGDDNGVIKLWDTRQGNETMEYSEHKDFISDLAFSAEHKTLVSTSGDGTLSVYDIRRPNLLAMSDNQDDELLSIAIIKSGRKAVVGSQEGILNLFSWGNWGDCSDRFPGHPNSIDTIVKITEDLICTGSSDGIIRAVGILPNKFKGVIGDHGDDMPIERIRLSYDQNYLASCSHDNTVKFWDIGFLFNLEEEDNHSDDDAGTQQMDTDGDEDSESSSDDEVDKEERNGISHNQGSSLNGPGSNNNNNGFFADL